MAGGVRRGVRISGVAFLVLTAAGIRQLIVAAIPFELYAAVAAGVGLFIAFIGFRNAGLIAPHPATLVTLGNLRDPHTLLAIFGLLATAALLARRVPAAMLIGILLTTAVGIAAGLAAWNPQRIQLARHSPARHSNWMWAQPCAWASSRSCSYSCSSICSITSERWWRWDSARACSIGRTPSRAWIVFSMPTRPRRLSDRSPAPPPWSATSKARREWRRAAAAVLRLLSTGAMFIVALFVAPLLGAIPAAATAPALIVVGSLMMTAVGEVDWKNPEVSIPAFLTMLAIPLTFSIANGLAFGFIAYTALKIALRQVPRCQLAGLRSNAAVHCPLHLSKRGVKSRALATHAA